MKKNIIFSICIFSILLGLIFYLPNYKKAHVDLKVDTKTIGVLTSSESGLSKVQGLIDGLKEYGYYKENINIIVKNTDGDKIKLEGFARELIDEKPDIILSTGPFETLTLKELDPDVPVAFIGVGCSVELGIIEDEAHPGGNITGVDSHYVQLTTKRLEYFKKIVPNLNQVVVFYDPDVTPVEEAEKIIRPSADRLGIDVKMMSVRTKNDIMEELREVKGDDLGVMLMCNFLRDNKVGSIIEHARDNKIPLMGLTDLHVKKGALAFYGGTDYSEGYQAARIVASILKGQSPKIIPIESPEKLEFHLNTKTLEELGIPCDESIITFVDKFIDK